MSRLLEAAPSGPIPTRFYCCLRRFPATQPQPGRHIRLLYGEGVSDRRYRNRSNVTGLEIPDHRSELGEVPIVFLGHHRLPALVGLGQHLGS
jgi:hypothetical protein